MIICVNSKGKKARVAKSISDERDFMIKIVWDIEGHYIMIKWPMNQENIIVINIYLNYKSPDTKQKLIDLKGKIQSSTKIAILVIWRKF